MRLRLNILLMMLCGKGQALTLCQSGFTRLLTALRGMSSRELKDWLMICLSSIVSVTKSLPLIYLLIFGRIPLEDISKDKHSKADFRITRLEGMKYTLEHVVPWFAKAKPVAEAYDIWKNSVATAQVRNPDPQPLRQFCNEASLLTGQFNKLERYKMPEYQWSEVSEIQKSLSKLSEKCAEYGN